MADIPIYDPSPLRQSEQKGQVACVCVAQCAGAISNAPLPQALLKRCATTQSTYSKSETSTSAPGFRLLR
eukprot:m.1060526 g.1060526  ORF g.1060526 m.1060526 type:complete len:70 (-) comp24209_c0_seq88:4088-4297(-)